MHSLSYDTPDPYHWFLEIASSNLWNSIFLLILTVWLQHILLQRKTQRLVASHRSISILLSSHFHIKIYINYIIYPTLLPSCTVNASVEVSRASVLSYLMDPALTRFLSSLHSSWPFSWKNCRLWLLW